MIPLPTDTRAEVIMITIHHRIDDEHEAWQVSDDGGEFDDSEEYVVLNEADVDAEDRHKFYVDRNPYVTVKFRNT